MDTNTNTLTGSKVFLKGLIIAGLALLLLIPTYFIKKLIEEREARQKEAIAEVSSKWAGKQIVTGPVIVLPYMETITGDNNKKTSVKRNAYFLPDELDIKTEILPQQRTRGIYKVMLYSSKVNISGKFQKLNIDGLKISSDAILWNEAFVRINILDPKGLNEELKINLNDYIIVLYPYIAGEGLAASLPLSSINDVQDIRFSLNLELNGSEKMHFTPVGKITTAGINSKWAHPSFTGNILPQVSNVSDTGFSATWKSMTHNRYFPQQWKDAAFSLSFTGRGVLQHLERLQSTSQIYPVTAPVTDVSPATYEIASSSFGVDLFIPVNGYQKTLRSIKYAALCIVLTFCAFFLIETINKRSVHPFQYGLVGLALVLFYTLLLSISEYTGFDIAYGIASTATIGLIGWFVKGILNSAKLSVLLSVVLVLVYSYIFTILQLQDYALLFGSIGLFLVLALVMYFSRKLNW